MTAYLTIAENLRLWKWHMAIAFHFSPSTDITKLITLPIYRLPTLLSVTKEGLNVLWTWCFSPSFPCTSSAEPVTQPGTTRIHNRGPKYKTFSCNCDNLNIFADAQSALFKGSHTVGPMSYTKNRTCQVAYKYTSIKICYKINKFSFEWNKSSMVRGTVLT